MCGRSTSAGLTGWRARWGWRGERRTCIRVVLLEMEVVNVRRWGGGWEERDGRWKDLRRWSVEGVGLAVVVMVCRRRRKVGARKGRERRVRGGGVAIFVLVDGLRFLRGFEVRGDGDDGELRVKMGWELTSAETCQDRISGTVELETRDFFTLICCDSFHRSTRI